MVCGKIVNLINTPIDPNTRKALAAQFANALLW